MMGRLHVDLSFQNRYLLNGVEIRLRLIRSKDIFCLHGSAFPTDTVARTLQYQFTNPCKNLKNWFCLLV